MHLISTTPPSILFFFFFFNDTATTEIYTLSLHDALPICYPMSTCRSCRRRLQTRASCKSCRRTPSAKSRASSDRKSTRLNSSHGYISYAVFCLKKKNKTSYIDETNGLDSRSYLSPDRCEP